jgi:DNA (cytosine-5)-methyltransferase 1
VSNYYNDNSTAATLTELVKQKLVTSGTVSGKSICDLYPEELKGYVEHHFFAGIGGWDFALRMANWPKGRPVATGSVPCQPFSSLGHRNGVKDERHLWPAFRWIIAQCRFPTIFGEQVANKDTLNWVARVHADLEILGYNFGFAILPAACSGSPHRRDRIYWVADANSKGCDQVLRQLRNSTRESQTLRMERYRDYWGDFEQCYTSDGRVRRIQPRLIPLVNGIPRNRDICHPYGNAIVPQVAAIFIETVLEIL